MSNFGFRSSGWVQKDAGGRRGWFSRLPDLNNLEKTFSWQGGPNGKHQAAAFNLLCSVSFWMCVSFEVFFIVRYCCLCCLCSTMFFLMVCALICYLLFHSRGNALLWVVHCYLLLFIVLFIALSLLFDRCFNSVLLLVSIVSW